MITTIFSSAPEALCRTCVHAHIARGTRKREQIVFCNYGHVREITFHVIECTDYRNRNAANRVVRVAGFAEREPVLALTVARDE
jgi:hypothetical protein